jgi:hypothetical protein
VRAMMPSPSEVRFVPWALSDLRRHPRGYAAGGHVRLLDFEGPILVRMNGRRSEGVIYKPCAVDAQRQAEWSTSLIRYNPVTAVM